MPSTKSVKRLTDAVIEQERRDPPASGTRYVYDVRWPGLAVRIHPTRRVTITVNRRKWGLWFPGALDAVRTELVERLGAGHQGHNVRIGADTPISSEFAIPIVFRRFTTEYLRKNTSNQYVRDSIARFDSYIFPKWQDRDVRDITRKDVREIVKPIADKGKNHTANRTHALLSTMFNWCIENDLLAEDQPNPVQGVKKPGGKEDARQHILTDAELAFVWHAAGRLGYPWGHWFKLLILTGQRAGECATMAWAEVDLDAGTWIIPPEKYKTGVAQVVPLSPQALDVLASCERCGDFVFISQRGRNLPIHNHGHAKYLIDRQLSNRVEHVRPWRNHDLRRTMRTGLSTLGVLPFIGELVIGHKQSGVHPVYDLHRYDKQKREALELWGQHVLEIAERYKPAPTKSELHFAELQQGRLPAAE